MSYNDDLWSAHERVVRMNALWDERDMCARLFAEVALVQDPPRIREVLARLSPGMVEAYDNLNKANAAYTDHLLGRLS